MRSRTAIQHIFLPMSVAVTGGLMANLILWPRERLPAVADLPAGRYFTPEFIERAAAFRGPQSALAIATTACFVIAPLVLAMTWPRDRGISAVKGGKGVLLIAATAVFVVLATTIASLPFEIVANARARDYGLIVQGFGAWLTERLMQALIFAAAVAFFALAAHFLIRKLRRAWWAVFAAAAVALAAAWLFVAPVAIDPLFADFRPLAGATDRSATQSLVAQAGVDPGDILVVDAGERTTAINAYVTGLGPTRRVVLYDTLLASLNRAEAKLVIAHELGHARNNDVPRGLIWFAIAVLPAAWAAATLSGALARRRGAANGSPAATAMLLAAVAVVSVLLMPAANAYSRRIEARADAFAIRLTGNPEAQVAAERRLVVKNLSRPDSPDVLQFLFGTHPEPIDRIGSAEAMRREPLLR